MPSSTIALDELARMDAIIDRLLLLATADQPDFLQIEAVEVEPFLEDVFMRWSEVAPRAWRLGPLAPGTAARGPGAAARGARRARRERDQVHAEERRDRAARGRRRAGAAPDRGGGRGLRGARRMRSRGSSTALPGPTRRARGQPAGSDWGWRSWTRSRRPTAGAARCRTPGTARSSRSNCRRSRPARTGVAQPPPAPSRSSERTSISPVYRAPFATSVGVVTTPPRTPDSKSPRTRAATDSLRRSASNRSRSSPSVRARAHRCGSSSRP